MLQKTPFGEFFVFLVDEASLRPQEKQPNPPPKGTPPQNHLPPQNPTPRQDLGISLGLA